jgi:hypothetical protein
MKIDPVSRVSHDELAAELGRLARCERKATAARCCAFHAADGHRCGERRFLQFHHVAPYAAGGKPTIDNIELRCGAHNRYEARLFYDPGREYGGVGVDVRAGAGNGGAYRSLFPERVKKTPRAPAP